jgi:hypothetical protein
MKKVIKKQGFHRWAWLVVFLLGGLLMIYGGAQDVTLFFSPEGELAPVPSWHSVPPIVGLVCGLIVLALAVFNILWGLRLRCAESDYECKLVKHVVIISGVGMIADWVSGY